MPQSGPSTSRVPRRRWRMAFLLALGVVIAFFDRINLSVSQNALHASFGISLIAFGYLSSAFSWTYAAMQMPSGVLLDRFGVKRIGRIGTFIWSMSSFAAAVSPGLGVFVAARFLLGVAEAPTFPGNAKALGYWFPDAERGLGDRDHGRGGEVFLCHRSTVNWLTASTFWLAVEFCSNRPWQSYIFRAVLRTVSQPQRRQRLVAGGTRLYRRGGAQAEDQVRAKSRASIGLFIAPTKGIRARLGMGRLQLHFLSPVELASQLSFNFNGDGPSALGFLHQRVLAVRHAHRSGGWRVAGGCLDPARDGIRIGCGFRF